MTTLLEVSGVSVSFDGFKAINNLSFAIGDAELRAVIGPNGAGKTTFMDIITGKTKPDEGHVIWGPKSISLLGMSEAKIAQAGVGRKFQKPTVFEDQPVRDNLMMALKRDRSVWHVLRFRPTQADQDRVAELADEVGLLPHLDRLAGELSHGQKQWLEIGMLLAQEPQLLLVDEPAAGMTPSEREHTTELLVTAAQTRAVVVVEHDMEFIRRLNCRVTVLHEGSVLAEGNLDHVTSNQDHFVSDEIYDLFPVLKKMGARRGGDLSGGQQQQLAIARALLTRPKLLLLDEPTEGIQPNIIQQIGEVIAHLRTKGDMAIVLVEQFFDFAWGLGDDFIVLKRGEVVLAKPKAETTRDEMLASVAV
ncbi:UNVERIFIED_CONTAM: hypothetical protein GTU68_018844 [Idotea baltica]|nr:hypothetical protein [Idotea baltica]